MRAQRRIDLGISVTKCAAACDVTERIWRRWETGEPPACTKLRALVRVLQIEDSEALFLPADG